MRLRLRARRELRPVDAHIDALVANRRARIFRRFEERLAKRRIDRIGEAHVCDDSAPLEERRAPRPRPVDVLIDGDEHPRRELFAHRADRRERHDLLGAEHLQREDVRAVIDLVRRDAMPSPVPRQEQHPRFAEPPFDDLVARRAEWRLHRARTEHFEARHLIETTPTEHAQRPCVHLLPRVPIRR